MGGLVVEAINASNDLEVVCGFDKIYDLTGSFPVVSKVEQLLTIYKPDIIIDFSCPEATAVISEYAYENGIPIVIATTGMDEFQIKKLQDYSKKIPVFQSANMSFEVTLFSKLLRDYATKLGANADIEIHERHHNRKADSPSGTAKMLFAVINEAFGNTKKMCYGRTGKRETDEIGMSSERGGNIVGEHRVSFIGDNEEFSLIHTSYSRMFFAEGAVKAARFLLDKENGFYNMDDLVQSI